MKKFLYLIVIMFCVVAISCTNDDKESKNFKRGLFQQRYLDTIEVAKDSFVVNAVYTYSRGIAVEKVSSFTNK